MGLRGPGANPIKVEQHYWRRYPASAAALSAAARMRRLRERQRNGQLVVSVELDADDLEVLIAARLLDPRTGCFNREAIATAVRNYLRISRNA